MASPRKISCQIDRIIDHGERVYTLEMTPEVPLPRFRAGQFLHMTLDAYDPSGFWPESRVFSIASSPHDRNCVRICYSVKGRYTERMEKELAEGGTVWIKLPYGDFVIEETGGVVLLTGGTGISAFTAFIEALGPDNQRPVHLVYGVRTPNLLLFQSMLLEQWKLAPHFDITFFTEHGTVASPPSPDGMSKTVAHFTGRINLDQLWPRLADPASQVFYISGPPVMLAALSAALRERGIPPSQIRTDAWE